MKYLIHIAFLLLLLPTTVFSQTKLLTKQGTGDTTHFEPINSGLKSKRTPTFFNSKYTYSPNSIVMGKGALASVQDDSIKNMLILGDGAAGTLLSNRGGAVGNFFVESPNTLVAVGDSAAYGQRWMSHGIFIGDGAGYTKRLPDVNDFVNTSSIFIGENAGRNTLAYNQWSIGIGRNAGRDSDYSRFVAIGVDSKPLKNQEIVLGSDSHFYGWWAVRRLNVGHRPTSDYAIKTIGTREFRGQFVSGNDNDIGHAGISFGAIDSVGQTSGDIQLFTDSYQSDGASADNPDQNTGSININIGSVLEGTGGSFNVNVPSNLDAAGTSGNVEMNVGGDIAFNLERNQFLTDPNPVFSITGFNGTNATQNTYLSLESSATPTLTFDELGIIINDLPSSTSTTSLVINPDNSLGMNSSLGSGSGENNYIDSIYYTADNFLRFVGVGEAYNDSIQIGEPFNDYVDNVQLVGTELDFTNNGGVSTAFDGEVDLEPVLHWDLVGDTLFSEQPNLQLAFPSDDTEIRKSGSGSIPNRYLRFSGSAGTQQGNIILSNTGANVAANVDLGGILIEAADNGGGKTGDVSIYTGVGDSKANSGIIKLGTFNGVETNLAEPQGADTESSFVINSVNDALLPSTTTPLFDVTRNSNTTGVLRVSNSEVIVNDLTSNASSTQFLVKDPTTDQMFYRTFDPTAGTGDGYVSNVVLNSNNLDFTGVSGGFNGSIDLSGYLDNTDAQALSLSTNLLSITGNASTVDLSPYLDNTDNQDLSISSNILSLTNDPTTVDLSPYLDNTDAQDLSVTGANNTATFDLSGDPTFIEMKTRNANLVGIEVAGQDIFIEPEYVHGANINYNFTDQLITNGTSEVEYPLPPLLGSVSPSVFYYDWVVKEVSIWVDGDSGASCDLELVDENGTVLGNLGGTNGVGDGKNTRIEGLSPGFVSFPISSDEIVRLRASNVIGNINNIHVTMRLITEIN